MFLSRSLLRFCHLQAKGVGPTAALKRLKVSTITDSEKSKWLEKARIEALLGSCPGSHASFLSGTKAWAGFARWVAMCHVTGVCGNLTLRRRHSLGLHGREFPPTIDGLLAWACLFRHYRTFSNYLGYVRLGCQLLGVSDEVFASPMLRRAKASVRKKGGFVARHRMFIRHDTIRRIVRLVDKRSPTEWPLAMLFLATYVFLLRLPSEALPMTLAGVGLAHEKQAAISLEGDEVCLRLGKRKNLPSGSVIRRACWCKSCVDTCPVHTLWPFFRGVGEGVMPFEDFTPGYALKALRNMLRRLQVPQAGVYRTHDIRRGHAQDLLVKGASLSEILRAGQWKSPAFLEYLDLEVLEKGAVLEANLDESSSDDEEMFL